MIERHERAGLAFMRGISPVTGVSERQTTIPIETRVYMCKNCGFLALYDARFLREKEWREGRQ